MIALLLAVTGYWFAVTTPDGEMHGGGVTDAKTYLTGNHQIVSHIEKDKAWQIVRDFNAAGKIIPVDIDHKSCTPGVKFDINKDAVAVIDRLALLNNGAITARFIFSPDGLKRYRKGEWGYISPSFYERLFYDTGKSIVLGFHSVAVTNTPQYKSLRLEHLWKTENVEAAK